MEPENSPKVDEPETPAPPEPSEVVDRLVANPDWPKPSVLEDIIALGERAVGPLLDRMREALDQLGQDNRAEEFLYYGIGILGELKAIEGLPLLLETIKRDLEDISEFSSEVLGGFGPVIFEPLLEELRLGEMTGYPRARLINAVKLAAGQDAALRAQLGDVLKPILAELIEAVRAQVASNPPGEEEDIEDIEVEDEDAFLDEEIDEELLRQERYESQPVDISAPPRLDESDELMFLVSDLADLAHGPSRELIDQAFQEELIDPFWVDKESVDESYQKGGEPVLQPENWLEGYRRRRHVHFENERRRKASARNRFQSTLGPSPGRPTENEPPPPPPETIRNVGPKVSRNDPCWCGSGKKYKKCHLGKDERG